MWLVAGQDPAHISELMTGLLHTTPREDELLEAGNTLRLLRPSTSEPTRPSHGRRAESSSSASKHWASQSSSFMEQQPHYKEFDDDQDEPNGCEIISLLDKEVV